ncbi:hypothetical protein MASB_34000 [Mycobacteroides abscessus subsp. bolletii BD]|nr:hypothetical protein MASB_34000 [Mycobacteroides abscessus subsp. bolletii BD]
MWVAASWLSRRKRLGRGANGSRWSLTGNGWPPHIRRASFGHAAIRPATAEISPQVPYAGGNQAARLGQAERAILDALTDVCFSDDSQVVSLSGYKRIAELGETAGDRDP